MNTNNIINSRIFKFFDYIFRLVLINLLITIPSFLLVYLPGLLFKKILPDNYSFVIYIPLIFYLFQGIIAGTDTVRRFEMKETKSVFKPFFKSFKTYYFKGLIDAVIIIVIVLLFYNSITYFYNNINNGTIYIIGLMLSISFAIAIAMIIFHLPLVMTYFEGCKFYEDIKLAFMMAFQKPITTIIIILLTAIIIYFGFTASEFIVISCACSLPIYLMVKFTFKNYFIPYVRTHKQEEQ